MRNRIVTVPDGLTVPSGLLFGGNSAAVQVIDEGVGRSSCIASAAGVQVNTGAPFPSGTASITMSGTSGGGPGCERCFSACHAGSVSTRLTICAALGPLLVILIWYSKSVPAVTGPPSTPAALVCVLVSARSEVAATGVVNVAEPETGRLKLLMVASKVAVFTKLALVAGSMKIVISIAAVLFGALAASNGAVQTIEPPLPCGLFCGLTPAGGAQVNVAPEGITGVAEINLVPNTRPGGVSNPDGNTSVRRMLETSEGPLLVKVIR